MANLKDLFENKPLALIVIAVVGLLLVLLQGGDISYRTYLIKENSSRTESLNNGNDTQVGNIVNSDILAQANQFIEDNPENVMAWYIKAREEYDLGRYSDSVKSFEKAFTLGAPAPTAKALYDEAKFRASD
jgi:cytochrome c-type biogenesis protein CcmH/NrfG